MPSNDTTKQLASKLHAWLGSDMRKAYATMPIGTGLIHTVAQVAAQRIYQDPQFKAAFYANARMLGQQFHDCLLQALRTEAEAQGLSPVDGQVRMNYQFILLGKEQVKDPKLLAQLQDVSLLLCQEADVSGFSEHLPKAQILHVSSGVATKDLTNHGPNVMDLNLPVKPTPFDPFEI